MTKQWSVTGEMSTVAATLVFSGGSCNILNAEGKLLRNTERDPINDWLTEQKILFYDPQIHPDTHGVEYNYDLHHRLEKAARKAAKINLYEISSRTFGGISSLEIAADQFRWQEPMVIYFSDGNASKDGIPAYSEKGYPLFSPYGLNKSDAAMKAHYREFIKNANHMRRHLIGVASQLDTMTINFSDRAYDGDIIVTPERMHAAEMFRAVVMASAGHRVFITFTGGDKAQDEKGNPLFVMPENPPEIQMRTLLDQYVDEGNALRKAIAELVKINVFVRVVYTQRSAIIALEEVLRIKKIIR